MFSLVLYLWLHDLGVESCNKSECLSPNIAEKSTNLNVKYQTTRQAALLMPSP